MNDKKKNIIISIGFCLILILILLLNLIYKDIQVSKLERRKLAQFPEFTIEKIINGNFFRKFEEYTSDQFIYRNSFRKVKSFWNTNIYRQKDDNKIFEKNGMIFKIEYPLNEKNLKKSIEKINKIYNEYLQGMNVYYAIIPEKNYYLENDDHLIMDYEYLKNTVNESLEDFKYIDIWSELKLEDYYNTDIHWKQEKLQNVVRKIEEEMNLTNTSNINYEIKDMGEFFGTYYGQSFNKSSSDRLFILTNKNIEECTTYNYETNKMLSIYDKKETNDKYDIYLSGATPLIDINNPNAKTEKELLLFRDSFGSSLAPLLIENYKKITLIDIRYISYKLLDQYISFNNQDVLFLYNSLVLNQNIFR